MTKNIGGTLMQKKQQAYKKTEKWWLILTVVFYALYNLPGVPAYGDANGTFIHGLLTVLPLWILAYAGQIIINRQRKLKKVEDTPVTDEVTGNKEAM